MISQAVLAAELERVTRILQTVEPLYGYDLQAQLADTLALAGQPIFREHRLDEHDRPDIWIPLAPASGIAVEVKIKGTAGHTAKQLRRYLAHDQVAAAILVTTVAEHTQVPTLIANPKPIHTIHIRLDPA